MSSDVWVQDIEPMAQPGTSTGSLHQILMDSTSNCSSGYSQTSSSEAQVNSQSESLTSNSGESCVVDDIPVVTNNTLLKLGKWHI